MSDTKHDHIAERFRPAERYTHKPAPTEEATAFGFFEYRNLTLFGQHSANTACSPSSAALPFDPAEVIDNLRYERYCSHSSSPGVARTSAVRRIYYLLRPAFPVWFRKRLQQRALAGWQAIPFPRWPVDLTVDNLLRSLWARELEAADATSVPFVWFWPHGRHGCITMTHDVETSRGLDATVELAALDVSHGFRPSFQFIPETRYSTPIDLLETLRAMNAETNLHGLNHDGHLFDSERVFADRASKINRYGRDFRARGFRSPILYRNPDWFHYLDFEYDMSIPNVAHLDPQRGGCCTVFPYFIGEKLELPLTTIQDYSLFHVLNDYSIDIWRRQLDIIASANGLASFNIHPDYVTSEREHAVYVELLAYLQSQASTRNLWSASPGDIATWWRDRAAMTMEKIGNSWRIVGRSSERACIAYAERHGTELQFRIEK